jgi:TetR/AcrR family tetracycline transcriptional repressor
MRRYRLLGRLEHPRCEGDQAEGDDAGTSPGDAQEALFAIGAYVIGSATEWQAETERAQQQPLPDASDERLTALRAEILSDQPLLQDAILERLGRPPTSAFEFGLDLLIEGLRARYASPG